VTVNAAPRHAAARIFARWYSGLRNAHPVSVLRWLRNGVLLCVLAAALAYLRVATQAGNDIGAALRTSHAVTDIGNAGEAAKKADTALETAFTKEDVTLTGTGSGYVEYINEVGKDITLAAEGNAAGRQGTSSIQYAQAQLQTYLSLSENAVSDYGAAVGGPRLGMAAEGYASSSNGDLISALSNLKGTETKALGAQLGAWPLDPGAFWWALLGPVAGMVVLTMTTAHVLTRYFRRQVSRWLWGSLLVTAATAVAAGVLNWSDERHLPADPWAGHPATLTCALLLFLVAAVLAQLAYSPRLAEYRFESS
jgi:hypothetical protein